MNRRRAFTLIELAIVLVIIGIILSIGVGLYVNIIKNAKFSATRDIVKTACEAVKGYAKSHYELPDSSALNTLGIKTKDAYAKPLVYKYSSDLVSNNLCSYDSASLLSIEIQNPSGGSTTKNDVAFLIYSTGENRKDDTCSGSTCTIKPYGTDRYDDVACFYDINSLRADICPPKLIISGNLPPAVEDEFYRASVKVSGGVPPYTYTWGSLPCGLSYNGNTIYGVVNCNPADSNGTLSSCNDSKTLSLTVEDSLNPPPHYQDEKNFTLKIFPQAPHVLEDKLPEGFVSSSYNATLHAVGGSGSYTWNVSGLPNGLSGTASGAEYIISGTIASDAAGTYSVRVDLTSCETTTKFLPLIVNGVASGAAGSGGGGSSSSSCPTFYLDPSSTTYTATVGKNFSTAITPTGGVSPYTNTSCNSGTGTGCSGLSITCTPNQAVISGRPQQSGTCVFYVEYKDSCSEGQQTASGTYTINVQSFSLLSDLPDAYICKPYDGYIEVDGGISPYSWNLTSGGLPKYLGFCDGNSSNVCSIGGLVDTASGNYNFTVQVSDSNGNTASQSFTINVVGLDMTGINGADCSSSGITLSNDTGLDLYVKKSGTSTCQRFRNNRTLTVYPGEMYLIYETRTDCQNDNPVCGFSFCFLWEVETTNDNSNCDVSLKEIYESTRRTIYYGCTISDL